MTTPLFDRRVAEGKCGECGNEPMSPDGPVGPLCRAKHRERNEAEREKKQAVGQCRTPGCKEHAQTGYCEKCKKDNRLARKEAGDRNEAAGLCREAAAHGPPKPGCKLCQKCITRLSAASSRAYAKRKAVKSH